MPRTRSANLRAERTPYLRQAVGKDAPVLGSSRAASSIGVQYGTMDLSEPDNRAFQAREPSFAEWEQLSDEAIAHLTQDLDKELPPDTDDEDMTLSITHQFPAFLQRQPSPAPETHRVPYLTGSVTEETNAVIPTVSDNTELAINESPTAPHGEKAANGSQEDPIVINDDDDNHGCDSSRTLPRGRQPTRYGDMVSWSSPDYENEVIRNFESKWMHIQTYWLSLDPAQANDTRICAIFDQYNKHFEEVCDQGELAQGSATFLLKEWENIEARAEDCWTSSASSLLFRRRMSRFGGLMREFADMESLYDVIEEYRGTASDDE